jgi:hypothetical protein
MNVYLDPSIEEQIHQRIGDVQITEINVNIYGINVLYYYTYNLSKDNFIEELEIDWDEMR